MNINEWESELAPGVMAALTKEIGFKTDDMALENIDIQLEIPTKEAGSMVLDMVTADKP